MARRRVTFLTRDGCGLCAEALPKVQLASRWLGKRLEVVDITTEPELEEEYHLRIPVVLDGSGAVRAEGRINRRQAFVAVLKG